MKVAVGPPDYISDGREATNDVAPDGADVTVRRSRCCCCCNKRRVGGGGETRGGGKDLVLFWVCGSDFVVRLLDLWKIILIVIVLVNIEVRIIQTIVFQFANMFLFSMTLP